jgi:hypothetical protein
MTTTPVAPPPADADPEQNAKAHLEDMEAKYLACVFCDGDLEGRDISKEAKACLREHGFPDSPGRIRERIEQAARETALSVEVRSGWHTYGELLNAEIEEMRILLSYGGPSLQILCSVEDGEPCRPRMQHQCWGTPWTEIFPSESEREALEWFVSLFYVGG